MADIFVSYARSDRARVAPLVAALEAQGWSVWWDPAITPGEEFDRYIAAELKRAAAVLVVWTRASVESRWVRGEARDGADRGILVPARFEQTELPIDVRALHTVDLDHWNDDPASPILQPLLRALTALIDRRGSGAAVEKLASADRPGTAPPAALPDRYVDATRVADARRSVAEADMAPVGICRVRTRPLLVAGLAVLALVAGGFALLGPRTATGPDTPPALQTIAVLPFTNLTGEAGQEIVADGLAEEVANQLAAIPELRVTGRRSSFSFKGKNEDLRQIANKLGVANLLEGSLRSDGSKLRVTVQLINGKDGARLWSSRPYEHEQSGILAAQDEIAQDVARALSVTLDVGALNRAQGGTRNLEAARRYWEWRELELGDRYGLEDERRKVRLMREAVRLDPQFVGAWDGLAGSLKYLAWLVGDSQPEQAEQLRAEAEQAWDRVAELAPDSWVAMRKRSVDMLRAEEWAESEAAARRILESGPFSLERAQPLVDVLSAIGGYDEMIELQAQVIALEPQAMLPSRDQQWNLYIAGRFEESEAEYQRSRSLDGSHVDPDFLAFLRGLARKDIDPQALRDLFQRMLAGWPDAPQWVHEFGSAIPNREKMLAVLRKAFEAGDIWAGGELADALGDQDLALTSLRGHITRNRGTTRTWVWPWFLVHSGARADPRFKELMREAGLADYWRQSGKWADFCKPVGENDLECR